MANTRKTKWSKARRLAFEERKSRLSRAKPLEAEYVGQVAQTPAVDIHKLEDRAFRRGMLTALQTVVDALVRELR